MNNFTSLMENQSLNKTTDNVIEPVKEINKNSEQIVSTNQNSSVLDSDSKKEIKNDSERQNLSYNTHTKVTNQSPSSLIK